MLWSLCFSLSPTVRTAVQHFAAGVVVVVVAGELVPDIREPNPIAVIIPCILGLG